MDRQRWIDEWTDGCMVGYMGGWMDEWVGGRMDIFLCFWFHQ